MKSNIGIICVNDSNISMPGQSYKVSVKELFTTLIKKKTWNSSDQQDSYEDLFEILNCLNEEGSYGPFGFCQFTIHSRRTCTSC